MKLFDKLTGKKNTENEEVTSPDASVMDIQDAVLDQAADQVESVANQKSEEILAVHDYYEPKPYEETPVTQETETDTGKLDRAGRKMLLLKPWEIVWSWMLMSVPIIGWIFSIVWAIGLCKTRQKKYLARAFLIVSLMTLVFYAIAYVFYTLVFRLELNDLPTVVVAMYNWLWNLVASIFKK